VFTDADAESFEVMHEIWMDMPFIDSTTPSSIPYVFCRKCGLTEPILWSPDQPSADFLDSIKEAVKMFRNINCEKTEKCFLSHCFNKKITEDVIIKRYLNGKLANLETTIAKCSVCNEIEGSFHTFYEKENSPILIYFELFEVVDCKTIMMRKALE
jgi:hypothetical protein